MIHLPQSDSPSRRIFILSQRISTQVCVLFLLRRGRRLRLHTCTFDYTHTQTDNPWHMTAEWCSEAAAALLPSFTLAHLVLAEKQQSLETLIGLYSSCHQPPVRGQCTMKPLVAKSQCNSRQWKQSITGMLRAKYTILQSINIIQEDKIDNARVIVLKDTNY